MVGKAHPSAAAMEIGDPKARALGECGKKTISVGDLGLRLGTSNEIDEASAVGEEDDCALEAGCLEQTQGLGHRAGFGDSGIGTAGKKTAIDPRRGATRLADDGPSAGSGSGAPGGVEG